MVGDTGSNLVTGREPFFFPEAQGSDFLADGLNAKIKEPTGTLKSHLLRDKKGNSVILNEEEKSSLPAKM